MATIRQVMDGLKVLERYGSDQYVSAEHDILYAGSADKDTPTVEERAALEKAGWFWDASTESWAHFT